MPAHDVFLDTAALIALVRLRDSLHAAAVEAMKQIAAEQTRLVVSEWVLAEFLSGASAPKLRLAAAALTRRLSGSPAVTVVEAKHADFVRALAFFEGRADKDWSFVDCTSILICQDREIRRVLTHDAGFAQAGLEPLLR